MQCRRRRKRETVEYAPLLPDETCPRCGKTLVMKNGTYGLFIGCSGYPACRFKKNLGLYGEHTQQFEFYL